MTTNDKYYYRNKQLTNQQKSFIIYKVIKQYIRSRPYHAYIKIIFFPYSSLNYVHSERPTVYQTSPLTMPIKRQLNNFVPQVTCDLIGTKKNYNSLT